MRRHPSAFSIFVCVAAVVCTLGAALSGHRGTGSPSPHVPVSGEQRPADADTSANVARASLYAFVRGG